MTEDQIERTVERRMDSLDKRYMAGDLDRPAYDAAVQELDRWAQEQAR